MAKFVSFLTIAFVLSISSVEAAKKKPQQTAAGPASVQTTSPVQKRGGNAAWAPSTPGCRMSGRC